MSVVDAVTKDLELLRGRAPELADSALAATALVLAEQLDSGKAGATSKSMCAKALLEVMEQLRELAPPAERKSDGIDDLAAARNERLERARSSGAQNLDGTAGG